MIRRMSTYALIIGNKAYASWSLRAWLGLRAAGAPFDEVVIPLSRLDTAAHIAEHSPSGKVPALVADDGLTVWDSLAILEYLAERFPDAGLWPQDARARAVARSVSAEMHAGFAPLRREMRMDLKQRFPSREPSPAVAADIARITAIWRDCRARFGAGGPFLFGAFGIADCMYAPVVTRFETYGVPLDETCRAYADAVLALPAMRDWTAAAVAEEWIIEAE
jgi:glutathione S-transferase